MENKGTEIEQLVIL